MARCCILNTSSLARPFIGGHIRTGLFVNALVPLFDHLDVVGAHGAEPESWSQDFPGAGYVPLGNRFPKAVFGTHRRFDPYHLVFTADEVQRWRRYLDDHRPDVIVCEGIWFRQLIDICLEEHNVTIITNMHNIESELFRRFYRLQIRQPLSFFNPAVFFAKTIGYFRIRENEDFHFRISRMIMVCSSREARILGRRHWGDKTHTIPNTYYRTEAQQVSGVKGVDRNSVVFVGELGYGPNRSAAKYIIRNIAPLLEQRNPKLTVHIAGRTSDDYFTRLAQGRSNVTVSENIPDTDMLYANALCLVVPLRVGGGTRIKILEAMSRGVAVISTRQGAEGLDLTDGEDVLFAHSARDFVTLIERLDQDRQLAARIGANGHARYLERYAPDRITAEIRSTVAAGLGDDLTGGAHGRAGNRLNRA